MGTPAGWSPVDETKGWTPVDEAAPAEGQAWRGAGTPETTAQGSLRSFIQGSVVPYGQEIAGGVKRGYQDLKGMADLAKPRNPDEVQYGPTGRFLLHVGQDTIHGLDNAYNASSASRAQGEGLAGQTLSFMENAPVIGGMTRYAESGGTGMFNPKSVGAATEGATMAAAPTVAGAVAGGALNRGAALIDTARAKATLNDAIANAEGMTKQAKTLNAIDKGAQAIFNRAQSSVQMLQNKLKSDAQAAVQPAIEADRAAGSKPIVPIKAVMDVHKAMEDTGYMPTRQEQALIDSLSETPEDGVAKKMGYPNAEAAKADVGAIVFKDFVDKGAGGVQGGGLTLEKALQLRSAIGSAAAKARRVKNMKANMVLTNAYEGMNDSINGRMNELQGMKNPYDANGKPAYNRAFEQYNKNHTAAFELEDGFTANLLDKTLDHHEARQKLGDFTNANITQVTKQMKDKGLNAREFEQLQGDAAKTIAAHDSVVGKFNKSLYRQMLSGSPAEVALPLGVMMMMKGAGLYGMVPYMAATVMGKISGNAARMSDFGRVLRRLDISDKVLNTRTQPGALEPVQFPGPTSPTGGGGGGEPSPPLPPASPRDLIGEEAEQRLGTAAPPEQPRPKGVGSKLGTPEENKRIQAAMEGRGEKKQALESKDKAKAIEEARGRRARR